MASFKNLISNTSAQISSGGTITGDLVINGDLQVDGGGSLSFDEILEGTQAIDVTNTEAFLVRKNSDGGDVFVVDTTNVKVGIGGQADSYLYLDGLSGNTYFHYNHNDMIDVYTGGDIAMRIKDDDVEFNGAIVPKSGIAGNATNFDIHQTSDDASDNRRTRLGGGGDVSQTRGAYIELAGNEHTNTGQLILNAGDVTGGDIIFKTDNTTRLTIDDTSGNVLIGLSTADALLDAALKPALQVEGTTSSGSSLSAFRNDNGSSGPYLILGKSRGTSIGSDTAVQDNDVLGTLAFVGADGTDRVSLGARIFARVNGTPGSNDLPTELVFSTTADGAADTTERVHIKSGGDVSFTGWIEGNDQNVLYSSTSTGALLQAPATTQKIYFRDTNGTTGMTYDAANQRLGIGTDSPMNKAQINHSGADGDNALMLVNKNTTVAADACLGIVGFDSADGNVPSSGYEASGYIAVIASENHSATEKGGHILFGTTADNDDDDTGSHERMRLTSAGYLGIGCIPDYPLHIHGASDGVGYVKISDSNTGEGATDGARIGFNSGVMRIQNFENSDMEFYVNNTTKPLTLESDGTATFSDDITVSKSGNAFLNLTSTGGGARMKLTGQANETTNGILFYETTNVRGQINYNHADQKMEFKTGDSNTLALTIDSSQNVGIGTTTIDAKLVVAQASTDTALKVSREDQQNIQLIASGRGTVRSSASLALQTGGANIRMLLDDNSRISLSNNDSGTGNTIFGKSTATSLDAGSNYNVFIGGSVATSASISDATHNVGIGSDALQDITTADNNVAIGSSAMLNATTASSNVSIGRQSMGSGVATGSENVGIGKDSLYDMTSASGVTAVGVESAYNITSGSESVAIGKQALYTATTVGANTAVGYQALKLNAVANNTAVGHSAGLNTTGTLNTYVGASAGVGASGADTNNTGMGASALAAVTSGSYNTAVGAYAGDAITTSSNCTLIGRSAGSAINHTDANGTVCLGNDSGESITSAIGSTALGKGALGSNSTGDQNTAVGFEALNDCTAGLNTALGYQAADSLVSGTSNTVVGARAFYAADGSETNSTIIGTDAGNAINHDDTDGNVIIGNDAGTGGAAALIDCVAIGYNAMNSTGGNAQTGTVAIGKNALTACTSGSSNTAVGYECLDATDDGALNTAVGYQSLSANCGNGNVAVGYRAGYGVTGALNVLIGHQAGYDTVQLTSGTQNIVIGDNARTSAADSTNQVVIGRDAQGQGDNSVTLGNASILNVYAGSDGGAHVHCSGISFPATQSASGGANTQDDYEEGDWSPVISDGTNNATMHGSIGGRYTKVGNKVTVTAYILVTSLGSVSGAIRVTGLPFAVADNNRNYSAFAVSSGEGLNITAGHSVNLTAWKGTSYAKVWLWDSATGGSEMTGAELSADGGFMISGSYLTT